MSERHELFLQRLEPSWPSLTNSSIVCVAGPSPSRKSHSQKTHGEMHGLENETPKEVLYEVAVCIRLYRLGRGRGCKLRYLDAVRTAFDVVNFSVGRPGLQWLLPLPGPVASSWLLGPVSCRLGVHPLSPHPQHRARGCCAHVQVRDPQRAVVEFKGQARVCRHGLAHSNTSESGKEGVQCNQVLSLPGSLLVSRSGCHYEGS